MRILKFTRGLFIWAFVFSSYSTLAQGTAESGASSENSESSGGSQMEFKRGSEGDLGDRSHRKESSPALREEYSSRSREIPNPEKVFRGEIVFNIDIEPSYDRSSEAIRRPGGSELNSSSRSSSSSSNAQRNVRNELREINPNHERARGRIVKSAPLALSTAKKTPKHLSVSDYPSFTPDFRAQNLEPAGMNANEIINRLDSFSELSVQVHYPDFKKLCNFGAASPSGFSLEISPEFKGKAIDGLVAGGLIFSPLNDAADLSEVVTGYDMVDMLQGRMTKLSNLGRAASAIGLVIGNGGLFRRALGFGYSGKPVKDILNSPEFKADRIRAEQYLSLDAIDALTNRKIAGVSYKGKFWKDYPDARANPENFHKSHRATEDGKFGSYGSETREGSRAEVRHYEVKDGGDGSVAENKEYFNFDVELENLLDLSNPETLNKLGLKIENLVSNDYRIPQAISNMARPQYRGMIMPSARLPNARNIVLFSDLTDKELKKGL